MTRLAKWIAERTPLSRREVERAIMEGAVCVNGERITVPAFQVTAEMRVSLFRKPVSHMLPHPEVLLFYKPRGVLVTREDPEGRPTIFPLLPPGDPRWISVGRLDFNSEGLLLLSNSPSLAHAAETSAWTRIYRVRAFGMLNPRDLRRIERGITINGVSYKGCGITIQEKNGKQAWLEVSLNEGKNREVRILMRALDLTVSRLIRIAFGPFALGDLTPGDSQRVRRTDWDPFFMPLLALRE